MVANSQLSRIDWYLGDIYTTKNIRKEIFRGDMAQNDEFDLLVLSCGQKKAKEDNREASPQPDKPFSLFGKGNTLKPDNGYNFSGCHYNGESNLGE